MYPLFLHFEDSYYQYRDGMISEPQYASVEFAAFVDGLMREIAVGDADGSEWTERWREQAAAETANKD